MTNITVIKSLAITIHSNSCGPNGPKTDGIEDRPPANCESSQISTKVSVTELITKMPMVTSTQGTAKNRCKASFHGGVTVPF